MNGYYIIIRLRLICSEVILLFSLAFIKLYTRLLVNIISSHCFSFQKTLKESLAYNIGFTPEKRSKKLRNIIGKKKDPQVSRGGRLFESPRVHPSPQIIRNLPGVWSSYRGPKSTPVKNVHSLAPPKFNLIGSQQSIPSPLAIKEYENSPCRRKHISSGYLQSLATGNVSHKSKRRSSSLNDHPVEYLNMQHPVGPSNNCVLAKPKLQLVSRSASKVERIRFPNKKMVGQVDRESFALVRNARIFGEFDQSKPVGVVVPSVSTNNADADADVSSDDNDSDYGNWGQF